MPVHNSLLYIPCLCTSTLSNTKYFTAEEYPSYRELFLILLVVSNFIRSMTPHKHYHDDGSMIWMFDIFVAVLL